MQDTFINHMLCHLASGKTHEQIAAQLSLKTPAIHCQAELLRGQFNTGSMHHAVQLALDWNIISLEDIWAKKLGLASAALFDEGMIEAECNRITSGFAALTPKQKLVAFAAAKSDTPDEIAAALTKKMTKTQTTDAVNNSLQAIYKAMHYAEGNKHMLLMVDMLLLDEYRHVSYRESLKSALTYCAKYNRG